MIPRFVSLLINLLGSERLQMRKQEFWNLQFAGGLFWASVLLAIMGLGLASPSSACSLLPRPFEGPLPEEAVFRATVIGLARCNIGRCAGETGLLVKVTEVVNASLAGHRGLLLRPGLGANCKRQSPIKSSVFTAHDFSPGTAVKVVGIRLGRDPEGTILLNVADWAGGSVVEDSNGRRTDYFASTPYDASAAFDLRADVAALSGVTGHAAVLILKRLATYPWEEERKFDSLGRPAATTFFPDLVLAITTDPRDQESVLAVYQSSQCRRDRLQPTDVPQNATRAVRLRRCKRT